MAGVRRAFWIGISGACYGLDIWLESRRPPMHHTDAPCAACERRGPWEQWRVAALRRSR